MGLPDFLVIGAPKAGTTALHAALARHPELYLCPIKEPKFFLCDGEPPHHTGPGDRHSDHEWVWQRDRYEALFDLAPPGVLEGESTPLYLADPAAHRRIRTALPDVRLVAVLRDPVDRAYSNWAHLWADGLEPLGDFVAACGREGQRQADGWAPFWRYIGLGRYGEQLRELYSVFPRDRVLVLRYRDLVEEPATTLDTVCEFLGVSQGVLTEIPTANVGTYVAPSRMNRALQATSRAGASVGSHLPPQVWRKASVPLRWALQRQPRHRPELTIEQRQQLVGRFADDVKLLEELTGWQLDEWLGYRSGGTYSVRKSWAPSRRVTS